MQAILDYERGLSVEVLKVLHECKARVYGIADPTQVASRVPTLAFNVPGVAPSAVTEAMARAGIGIRDGHLLLSAPDATPGTAAGQRPGSRLARSLQHGCGDSSVR